MTGTFFAVVGPSGAGKDTVMAFAREQLHTDSRFAFPRRVITRAPTPEDEDHISVGAEEFETLRVSGAFLLDWEAHGQRYGVPVAAADLLAKDVDIIVNLSRGAVVSLRRLVDRVVVVLVTAPADLLAERLKRRGRESPQGVVERLHRTGEDLPPEADLTTIVNDGLILDAGTQLVRTLTERRRRRTRDDG